MTTLGPYYFGYNIRMVIKTEAAIIDTVSHKKFKYRQIHRLPEVTV